MKDMFICDVNLDKQWNGVQVSDDGPIHGISGQDMQCSCATLHNLLHPHTILREVKRGEIRSEN